MRTTCHYIYPTYGRAQMFPHDLTDIPRPSPPMTRRSNLTSWRGSRRLHRNPFSPLNPVHSFRRNKRVNKVKYNPFITASHHSTLDMRDALSTPPPEQAETSEINIAHDILRTGTRSDPRRTTTIGPFGAVVSVEP